MLFESEKVASPGSGHNGSWAFDADVAPGPWLHTLIGQQPLRRRSSTSSTRWCAHTPIWSLERALVMPSSPPDRRKRPADSGASPSAHTRTSSHAPATPAQKTPLGLGRRLLMEASAGAIAEALVEFLLYPLDTLKQTQQLPQQLQLLRHWRGDLPRACTGWVQYAHSSMPYVVWRMVAVFASSTPVSCPA
jgi:hypothetical protein